MTIKFSFSFATNTGNVAKTIAADLGNVLDRPRYLDEELEPLLDVVELQTIEHGLNSIVIQMVGQLSKERAEEIKFGHLAGKLLGHFEDVLLQENRRCLAFYMDESEGGSDKKKVCVCRRLTACTLTTSFETDELSLEELVYLHEKLLYKED